MALSKRHLGVLVLGVLLVSLALRFVPLSIGAFVAVNTETQVFNIEQWEAFGSSSFNGELLDGTQYITSWMHNGDSEKVIAQAEVRFVRLDASFRDGCRYLTSLNTGFGWQPMDEPIQEVPCGTTVLGEIDVLPVATWVLHSPVVGGIRVEYQQRTGYDLVFKHDFTWKTFVMDEAHLRPGVGDVVFDKPLYAIGQTAIIRYDVGYASSQKESSGWSIQLHEPPDRGGTVVKSWTVADNTRAQVAYTFALTDFVAGESNIFTVKLLNTLTGVKDDDTAVVDDIDLAPQISSVTVLPVGTRSVGDQMTVTILASPNELTGLPITEYYFHVRSGPANIIVDAWQATSVFTFTIQSDGDLQVNACVRDAERSNCARRINVLVEEPDNPFGTSPADPFEVPWWLWFSVGILLAFAFGVQLLPQIPQDARRLLGIFLLAGSAVLVLSYFVIPVLEAWIRDVIPGVS